MASLIKSFFPKGLTTSLLLALTSQSFAETQIRVIDSSLELNYSQSVRWTQVLQDVSAQLAYEPYILGMALYTPEKKHLVVEEQRAIIKDLKAVHTEASWKMALFLQRSYFSYREPFVASFNQARLEPKLNPLLTGSYELFLPSRPKHIFVIDPAYRTLTKLPVQNNTDVKQYFDSLPDAPKHNQAWVIQPNQEIYQIDNIQKAGQRFYVAPGATLFIGLDDLPSPYQDLNARIARLLAMRLE